jgi:hypothetical protein
MDVTNTRHLLGLVSGASSANLIKAARSDRAGALCCSYTSSTVSFLYSEPSTFKRCPYTLFPRKHLKRGKKKGEYIHGEIIPTFMRPVRRCDYLFDFLVKFHLQSALVSVNEQLQRIWLRIRYLNKVPMAVGCT